MAAAIKKSCFKAGVKTKKNGQPKDKREPKHCARCKLHGILVDQSREHSKSCPYNDCPNFLCRYVTTLKQLIMKVQLDVWRKRNQHLSQKNKKEKTLCDTCRNHCIRTNKKGHKRFCKFNSCQGILCRMTVARRKIVSFFLKIDRSDTRCEVFETNYQKAISERKISAGQNTYMRCTNIPKDVVKGPLLHASPVRNIQLRSQDWLNYPHQDLHRPCDLQYYPEDPYFYGDPLHYQEGLPTHCRNSYFPLPPTSMIYLERCHTRPKLFINNINYNLNVVSPNHTNDNISNGINDSFKHNMNSDFNKCTSSFHRPWI